MQRVPTLDILRLAAAFAVLVFHFGFAGAATSETSSTPYPELAPYAIFGYLGVNLFFMISGFVIAWSSEGRTTGEFALARFARLYPGYLLAMTLTFVVCLFAAEARYPVTISQYLTNLTMFAPIFGQTFMDEAYWTIVLELIFYGWVAIFIALGLFDRFRLGLVLIWLYVAAFNQYFLRSEIFKSLFITEFAPLFCAGILLHYLFCHGRHLPAIFLLAACYVMSWVAMFEEPPRMLARYGASLSALQLTLSNLTIYSLIIGAIVFRDRIRATSFVLMLGGLTYPLYLLHQNIGHIFIDRLAPLTGKWSALAAVTMLLLVVSWAIWRFVERPANRAIKSSGKGAIALIDNVVDTLPASHQNHTAGQT